MVILILLPYLRNSLVVSTFEDLEDGGCIKIEEDSVEPTMLGSIASQYYLKYTTVSMFASNIEADTSLEVSWLLVYRLFFYLFIFYFIPTLVGFPVLGFPARIVWCFWIWWASCAAQWSKWYIFFVVATFWIWGLFLPLLCHRVSCHYVLMIFDQFFNKSHWLL